MPITISTFLGYLGGVQTGYEPYMCISISSNHLYHNRILFFPLAPCFTTFVLKHVQKFIYRSVVWNFLDEKVTYNCRLLIFFFFWPFLFLLLLSSCSSNFTSAGLASSSNIFDKASLRWEIFTTE